MLSNQFTIVRTHCFLHKNQFIVLSSFYFLVGLKALEKNTPRDQAIYGIQVIDGLKERLQSFLEIIATEDDSRPITAEDIESFFSKEEEIYQSRKRKRQRGGSD